MKKSALSKNFFNKPTLVVAKSLLGKFLATKNHALMITEVEAYIGPQDKACHAYKGLTARTKIMFGPAGRWYVYFTYGTHWMLNIVTGPKGYPAAVLIRGTNLVSGPARLTKFLGINGRFNGCPANKQTGLWVEDRGIKIFPRQIKRTPRIGVDYAGEWARKPYRFFINL